MVMNFLDAAADLVSLGFKVFPLVPGRKLPLIKAWQKQASDDLDTITAWSKQWPNANIAHRHRHHVAASSSSTST